MQIAAFWLIPFDLATSSRLASCSSSTLGRTIVLLSLPELVFAALTGRDAAFFFMREILPEPFPRCLIAPVYAL